MSKLGRPKKRRAHGTVQRYRQGCRCDRCKAGNTEFMREYRGLKPRRYGPGPHGTHARYNYKPDPCRCDACRKAHSEFVMERLRRNNEEWDATYGGLLPDKKWTSL